MDCIIKIDKVTPLKSKNEMEVIVSSKFNMGAHWPSVNVQYSFME